MAFTLAAFAAFMFKGFCCMFYIVSPWELALDENDTAPKYLEKYGIPMFFTFMLIEKVAQHFFGGTYKTAAKADGKDTRPDGTGKPAPYRLNDMLMSTLTGSFQRSFLIFFELMGLALEYAAYTWIYRNYRLYTFDIKNNVVTGFIAMFLLRDCAYYWMHRGLHEFHLFWTAHGVHHSGEDYDLATGLRQGALQPLFGFMFYLPIAFMGFPPPMFAAHSHLNTLYQYWVHTDVINRLPFGLEYIFNSPMAHRLHHRPPGNRNYAAVLIWWDRIFGTYEAEVVRKDLYGLARQPNTFDPIKLNSHHFFTMANIRGKTTWGMDKSSWLYRLFARRVRAKWVFRPLAIFEPIPALKEDARVTGPSRTKWNGASPMGLLTKVYFGACAVGATLSLVMMLEAKKVMHPLDTVAALVALMLGFTFLGQIADQRKGEWVRACVLAPVSLGAMAALVAMQPFGARTAAV